MTEYNIIAIDPGESGAIVASIVGMGLQVHPMPDTLREILNVFCRIQAYNTMPFYFVTEDVGTYMPGNSGPWAVKFARHVGVLEGLVVGQRQPSAKVRPAKWEHWYIGKPNYDKIPKEIQGLERKRVLDKRKRERKNKIKAKAQAQFPHLEVDLKTSDALGILSYACANLKELFPTIGGQHVRSKDEA